MKLDAKLYETSALISLLFLMKKLQKGEPVSYTFLFEQFSHFYVCVFFIRTIQLKAIINKINKIHSFRENSSSTFKYTFSHLFLKRSTSTILTVYKAFTHPSS